LEKLSARLRRIRHPHRVRHKEEIRKPHEWRYLVVLSAWVLFSFLTSVLTISGVVWIMTWLHQSPEQFFSPAAYQTLTAALVYVLALVIALGVPFLVRRHKTTLSDVGLTRLVSWTDIGLAPLAFIAYILVAQIVLATIIAVVPGFPADEVQDVGFSPYGSQIDTILAFMTLVVIAPLAEEVLFRGYLYGKLKAYVPGLAAAIVTSALFGLVHLQWNVAVDVFILSMFLCGLRSLTGSIWAGVLVHMLKNAIAYYLFMNQIGF